MMRLTASLLVGLLAAPAAAAAEETEGRQWIGSPASEGGSLLYGTPESDDILLGLACDPETKHVTVFFAFEPVGAEEGVELDMELSSEGGSIVLAATGHRMMLDDTFILEATAALEPELRRIVAEGETLVVTVQDGAEEIPLDGAAEQSAGLFETCG